jgi:hypothetical protein
MRIYNFLTSYYGILLERGANKIDTTTTSDVWYCRFEDTTDKTMLKKIDNSTDPDNPEVGYAEDTWANRVTATYTDLPTFIEGV